MYSPSHPPTLPRASASSAAAATAAAAAARPPARRVRDSSRRVLELGELFRGGHTAAPGLREGRHWNAQAEPKAVLCRCAHLPRMESRAARNWPAFSTLKHIGGFITITLSNVPTHPARSKRVRAAATLPVPCASAPAVAKTLPVPCAFAPAVAKTLPVPCVFCSHRGSSSSAAATARPEPVCIAAVTQAQGQPVSQLYNAACAATPEYAVYIQKAAGRLWSGLLQLGPSMEVSML